MGASMVALMPLVLLGLVAALCFVGCALQTGGLDLQGPYRDTVTDDPNIVACWPLNDQSDTPNDPAGTTAIDIGPNKFNGTYTGAAGSLKVQQEGIVPGDAPPGGPPNSCAFFNGGFVAVPFEQALNPAKFTIEAWVEPSWTADDTPTAKGVVLSLNTPLNAGYALFASQTNMWTAGVGTGTAFPSVALPITFEFTSYLAMTFDGSVLTLFVGIVGGTLENTSMTIPGTFLPEQSTTTATQLNIGIGRPDLPAGMFPFDGFIQDVAVYNDALAASTIMNHFNVGKGG